MTSQSFQVKKLVITVFVKKGQENLKYTFTNGAMDVSVRKCGGGDLGEANVAIYGLSVETMKQLVWTNYRQLFQSWNQIVIQAGDVETPDSDLPEVYYGDIMEASADLNGAKPVLRLNARTGAYLSLKPDSPLAINGSVSVADLVKKLAEQDGYRFENNGVTESIRDCVLNGSPLAKMQSAASHVGAYVYIDNGIVFLSPLSKERKETAILINKDTGLIGYPTVGNNGIAFATNFNPRIQLASKVSVESVVPGTNGVWLITSVTHTIRANNPTSQAWRTDCTGLFMSDTEASE